jgi:16S rRNA (guanine527-N7)-methyltransferase
MPAMEWKNFEPLGLNIDAAAHARLARFVDALLQENERMNLTAIRSADGVWARHVVDSLAVLPLIDAVEPARIADVGSGGGVPGIPLACARPGIDFTLIDSTAKKMAAAKRMIDAVGLSNVRCEAERAEVLAHQPRFREKFDVVVARAVGALAPLVEWVAGLVRVEGQCWLFKSLNGLEAEIEAAREAARQCRLDLDDVFEYELPGDLGRRAVVIYSKVDTLPRDLPRPPWKAKGKPL